MSASGRAALVIGHRGQDGTLLRQRLEAEGTAVVGIGRQKADCDPDISVDLCDADATKALLSDFRPVEVYYLAGHHGSSERMPTAGDATDIRRTWETHVDGFRNVLDAVARSMPQTPVLLAASSLIYAPGENVLDECSRICPDTVYGLTKAAAVLLARERRKLGQLVHTLTLFPHESGLRGESFVASKIVRTGLRIAAGSDEVLAIGDPDTRVDWSLARDVVAAMVDVIRFREPTEVVIANGRAFSVRSLATEVFSQLGLDICQHLEVRPSLLTRPSTQRLASPQRLREQLSWWPELDLSTIAARLIEEHREALCSTH